MDLSGTSSAVFQPGDVISALNECGVFLCMKGEVELSLDNELYRISEGDMYIYMPSTLVRLLHRSADTSGILITAEADYVLPIVQRVANAENLLHLRLHPYVSLKDEEYVHLKEQIKNLQRRMAAETGEHRGIQHRHLMSELFKSMGQTLVYEVLNIYFAHQPLQPVPQGKKDQIFHQFLLSLFRHFRSEREVAFYAGLQHLTPRYFASIIKEKSGTNALQWIVQMVITEAKLLLETSDLSIKEISVRLNFPTQSFFGKYFKQYVGVSPKDYRERLRKEK
ncbi:MAG: AraC family transcriptional regulator [Bacteroidaceae bacterium]|nr:AraC family transcriptional regulator [Bacteroidaceae bacterium]